MSNAFQTALPFPRLRGPSLPRGGGGFLLARDFANRPPNLRPRHGGTKCDAEESRWPTCARVVSHAASSNTNATKRMNCADFDGVRGRSDARESPRTDRLILGSLHIQTEKARKLHGGFGQRPEDRRFGRLVGSRWSAVGDRERERERERDSQAPRLVRSASESCQPPPLTEPIELWRMQSTAPHSLILFPQPPSCVRRRAPVCAVRAA
jgi:hypothetical protein